jgi:kynurenine formamidase
MGFPGRPSFSVFTVLLLVVFLPMTFSSRNKQEDSLLSGIAGGRTRVVDLSYAINDKLVPWPGDEKWFEAKVNATVEKNGYFTRSFWMLESAKDADYQAPAKRVEQWEAKHGRITEGSIVLLRTGWASRWPDAGKYRNQDAQGKMHFPGFSVEAAKLLVARKVSGIGCDTLSTDYGASEDFAVHHLVLGAGLYQLENLANLPDVPEAGAFLIVAPIKLAGGSGGAVRVFAIWQ